MNRAEVVELLALVQGVDRRTVGEIDVLIWHMVLAPLDLQRAREAVVSYARHKPDVWLKPGHVWQIATTSTVGGSTSSGALARGEVAELGPLCEQCKCFHQPGQCASLVRRPEIMRAITNTLGQRPGSRDED